MSRLLRGLGYAVLVGSGLGDLEKQPNADAMVIAASACPPDGNRQLWRYQGRRPDFRVVLMSRSPSISDSVQAIALSARAHVFDTMTDGGLGAALLWPFSLTRFFAPWNPIPVAPIGLEFFTLDGATVALSINDKAQKQSSPPI